MEFTEEQKFTQWWLWLILIPLGVLPVIGAYFQIARAEPIGDNAISDKWLIISAAIMLFVIGLFLVMKLKTRVDDTEIQMSFFPFLSKKTEWTDIKKAEVINYGFVGGWGIRLWTQYGTVYNIKGNKGLAIELLNGKKFLIGTQKETELDEIVKRVGGQG